MCLPNWVYLGWWKISIYTSAQNSRGGIGFASGECPNRIVHSLLFGKNHLQTHRYSGCGQYIERNGWWIFRIAVFREMLLCIESTVSHGPKDHISPRTGGCVQYLCVSLQPFFLSVHREELFTSSFPWHLLILVQVFKSNFLHSFFSWVCKFHEIPFKNEIPLFGVYIVHLFLLCNLHLCGKQF